MGKKFNPGRVKGKDLPVIEVVRERVGSRSLAMETYANYREEEFENRMGYEESKRLYRGRERARAARAANRRRRAR